MLSFPPGFPNAHPRPLPLHSVVRSPQVVADFVSELDMVEGQTKQSLNDAIRQRMQRQANFLKRKHGSHIASTDIRPRKKHRKSALQWLLSLDNQVRVRPSVGRICSALSGRCIFRVACLWRSARAFATF